MATHFAVVVLFCLKFYLTSSNIVFNDYDPNELEVGSSCRFHGNKSEGICRDIRNCPGAHRDFHERNISPTICAFHSDKSYTVCCGYKRRYENACASRYGEPDTDKVCSSQDVRYHCDNDSGSEFHTDIFYAASGGVRAGPVEHMAALGWRSGGRVLYKCGGTLISEYFVLTAAHCTQYNGLPPSIVRLTAEHLLDEDPDFTFEVLEIITHPEYRPSIYYHDIALIRINLNKIYEKEHLIVPSIACLPPEHLIYDEDIIYDASRWGQIEALGYGATSFGGPTDDMHLVKVSIDLLPDKRCTESFSPNADQPIGHQKSIQICAGDINKGIRDTCQGDSGGPLQRLFKETLVSPNFYYVFGVTSYGRACATGEPAVYTRVASYLDWIESIVWPINLNDTGSNYNFIFGCEEEQKLCLKKIRSYYKHNDPNWPVGYHIPIQGAQNQNNNEDQNNYEDQTEYAVNEGV